MPQPKIQQTNNKKTKNNKQTNKKTQANLKWKFNPKFWMPQSKFCQTNKQINKNKQKHKQIWRGSLIWNFECSKIYQTNRLLFFNKEITFLIEMMCCFHFFFDQRKIISLKFWSILFLQKTDLGMFHVF